MIREQAYSSQEEEPAGNDLLNRKELADRLGCSPRTIDTWQQEGRIPFTKPKGAVYFSWAAVLQRLKEIQVWPGDRRRKAEDGGRRRGISHRRERRERRERKTGHARNHGIHQIHGTEGGRGGHQ